MLDFLRDYIKTAIHLVSIVPDAGSITGKWFGDNYQSAAQWAQTENIHGKNVYWTVNVTSDGLDSKPKKSDITGLRFAHVDIDPPKGVIHWDKAQAFADLQARGNPSFVIDSGNGWQALWRLDAVANDQTAIEDINRGLEASFSGDHCWNIDRLLRLPGTTNWPDAKKRAAGRVPTAANVGKPDSGYVFTPSVIAQYFPAPVREVTETVQLTSGPSEGYTGPADDDELIKRMTSTRGGVASVFGDKATIKDLWEGNVAVLSRHFPSVSGGDFDHSAADASLFAHLAFWTGKDGLRMDRLFRRSALMREKYANREDYRVETIKKAVGGCRAIYNVPAKVAEITPLPLPGVDVDPTQVIEEVLTVEEQKNYFKGCVYVSDEHKILIPNGNLLKSEQFNAWMGGHLFIISGGDGQPTKKAFEAFTENRAYKFPRVIRTTFDPKRPFGDILNHEVNTYFPDPSVRSVKGDVSRMLRHVEKMVPDDRDREILWSWLAAQAQFVGAKFQWAPFLQGTQGNGKSMLATMMKYVVGPLYYHKPFADDIDNKFNDFMDRKLFIDIQEITLENKYGVYENLKEWITSDYVEMQPKGGKKTMRMNLANWMITSNHKNALPFATNERRLAPFFTAQQSAEDVVKAGMSGTYFPELWAWLRDGDGYANMVHYLQHREIHEEFNPAGSGAAAARAPITTSTREAESTSLGRAEQEINEAIASETRGFRNGWISSIAYAILCKEKGLRYSPQKNKQIMENIGFREHGRASRIVMEEEGKRPVLYIKRELWRDGLSVDDYCFAQGYQTAVPNIKGLVAA